MFRLFFAFILIISVASSCVSDKAEGPVVSDETLFNLAQNNSSFSYLNDSPDTLQVAADSPHGSYVRIRFNPKARSAMDDSLTRLVETSFPDESMIVKEVYLQKGGPLFGLSVMYKLHNASNSGSGWLWNEMEPDGNPTYSVGLKGDQCRGCHSANSNSDLVRTFSLH